MEALLSDKLSMILWQRIIYKKQGSRAFRARLVARIFFIAISKKRQPHCAKCVLRFLQCGMPNSQPLPSGFFRDTSLVRGFVCLDMPAPPHVKGCNVKINPMINSKADSAGLAGLRGSGFESWHRGFLGKIRRRRNRNKRFLGQTKIFCWGVSTCVLPQIIYRDVVLSNTRFSWFVAISAVLPFWARNHNIRWQPKRALNWSCTTTALQWVTQACGCCGVYFWNVW
jgi:hypothetical protein